MMGRVITEEMTLSEFIQRMKDGWGFWRPYTVQRIGRALEKLIPPELLSTKVTVTYKSGSYGYGPNFHYTYRWEVEGVTLPLQSGRLPPDLADILFGYLPENLPFIRIEENKFEVGYDW